MSEHDQERMLCEECGKNEAVCTVATVMGKQVLHRHLCQECMARISMSIATGNIGQLLGSIMAAVGQAPGTAAPKQKEPAPVPELPKENPACSQCGTTLHTFLKSGRLGCAGCYAAFRVQVEPMLQKLNGTLEYRGRRPLRTEAALRSRSLLEGLQRQLEAAVAAEDYERAAQLRDTLRAMAEEGQAR